MVVRPVSDRYCNALDYRTYHLAHKLLQYNDEVARSVAERAEHLRVQMRTNDIDIYDPISIINVLSSFKLACDTTSVQEGAEM